ncbi:MAG: signal peptidase I [Firmicutes bacterium]|nr:signal peptidase I [Bacillota bacterium]
MNMLKKAGSILLSVLLWAVILLAALYTVVTLSTRDETSVSSIAGYTPLVVKTDSMAPTFRADDLILIRRTDTSKLEVGDIITFHTIINNEYALNTHRIADIADMGGGVRSYTTKGDNNAIADQHVISDGDIVGKYVGRVPGLGKVISFLSSSVGFLVVIVLPMLIFFIYQVYNLIMVSLHLRKAIQTEEAGEAKAASQEAQDAEKARAEAMAALEEAKRLKAEAEAVLQKANKTDNTEQGENHE